ncbi:lysophosphatidylcholine acyltransferase isoform X2 [Ischnura elegans]|uniref:lysophosphatidylcholine acyltransferase isoform X1 n=1 Tax=Ischnura elegans TaxID=197161 RepID=UPI001ED89A6B|nr:lysophosphatidylcholine acyltransferase isoform X1 [Ischnura elegans]XP_046397003.1 lysophosphatidylcholine acyltransferase isoform X2 [Ischnura elegans]
MDGKPTAEEEPGFGGDLTNPFVHHLELSGAYEKIKTAVLTVALLPLRVLIIAVLLVVAWCIAVIGLFGLSEDDLQKKPLSGWRRSLTKVLCLVSKTTYRVGGMKVTLKGRQATRAEAPILVIAPHSTFLDAVIVYFTGYPSIIVRRESGLNPFIGKLINYTQPIYVWRLDPESRQETIREIVQRTTSSVNWPQVLIFPEGTCTNRTCLITFKHGAFCPGVPVQPVCIRYPNRLDTVTWTWEGPGALKLLWLTLTQIQSTCEIEFLPVYHPSPAEKADPKLYANNVRMVMAKALGVPVSDYTYDDCRLMRRARRMLIPNYVGGLLVEIQRLRHRLGLQNGTEDLIKSLNGMSYDSSAWRVDINGFASYLNVSPSDSAVHQLFHLFDKESTGKIDLREYLLGVLAISKASTAEDIVQLAFQVFRDHRGGISVEDATSAMSLCFPRHEAMRLFQMADARGKGFVTYEEFRSCVSHLPEYGKMFSSYGRSWSSKTSDDIHLEKKIN